MKISQSKTLLVAMALPIFANMTREELRNVARACNVPRGRNTKDTIANLQKAVADGKCHVKTLGYIYSANDKGERAQCVFLKKLRTYKASKTVFAPPQGQPLSV